MLQIDIGPDGAGQGGWSDRDRIKEVGGFHPPTEIEKRLSLIKGNTGRWEEQRQGFSRSPSIIWNGFPKCRGGSQSRGTPVVAESPADDVFPLAVKAL